MHRCPIDGCSRQVDDGRLMCGPHWFRVPLLIREQVWCTWRRRNRKPKDPARIAEHHKAMAAALRCGA